MDYIPCLWCLSHVFISHVKYMATHSCPLVPHIISHTYLLMAWCFADEPVSPRPRYWEVYGLDAGHPCIWIAVQAYQIIHMHQQDMRHWVATHPLPPIHHNHIRTHTSLRMDWWSANPAKYWPIVLEGCGLDGWHPSVCVTSPACDTFPMHPQDM